MQSNIADRWPPENRIRVRVYAGGNPTIMTTEAL